MAQQFQANIIIVGAGLGGLSAAIAISRAGHRVTVVEQAPELGEVGAGIQVPPNSSRILDRWGILQKIVSNAMHPENIVIHSYKDGSVLSTLNLRPSIEEMYGGPYLHVHRATFHKVLVEAAEKLGVKFQLGSVVTGIDFGRTAVKILNKANLSADFIIAADGLKSPCREALLGRSDPPRKTGDMGYRLVIKTEEMKKYPELVQLATVPSFYYWAGPNGHAVGYLIERGTAFNMVITAPDELPDNVPSSKVEPQVLMDKFKNWEPRFKLMLELVKEVMITKLQNSIELETWTHPGGRFALLGDACHATLPYLAQGAAQAVEDGAVLGGLFKKAKNESEMIDALRIYEKLRKSRTTRVVRASTDMGHIMHYPDGEEQRERDRVLTQCEPFDGYPNKWADPVFQKYLFGYDADTEVEEAWSTYEVGRDKSGMNGLNSPQQASL
ncbi:hypothetical protein F5884DRAFT_180757 [Xylogone sp. PMI_703]|nr:hypothetical protein F5884DRAFT_180757 [Xylogone sp. PMI_703]